jgi:RNA polymerase sigma-70 factor (ECF subfamily)
MSDYSNMPILISSLKQKDEKAYAYLYDNYSAALYGIIFKVVNNEEDACDVLQDSFVNIWKNIESYDGSKGGSLFTWMLHICRNKAIDRYRQKNRVNENQKDYKSVHIHNEPANTTNINIDKIGVQNIIEKIKPEHKEIIIQHYFKGYTHQEISTMSEMPLGSVKTKIRNAMIEIKNLVGKK